MIPILDVLGSYAARKPPSAAAGRAWKRLRDHAAQWDHLPMEPVRTRQLARAASRADYKRRLSDLKKRAMAAKVLGGSAVVQ